MSAKYRVRFRRLNGTLIVQRPKFLWGWYNFTDYQNIVHDVDYRLNSLSEEFLDLIELRSLREKQFDRDVKLTDKDKDQDYGYSEPFLVELSALGTVSLNVKPPKKSWKELPGKLKKLLKQERLTVGGRVIVEDDRAPRSSKSSYVPEEFKQFSGAMGKAAEERGVDNNIVYRSNKDQDKKKSDGGGGSGGGSFDPSKRKKQSGETPEGHSSRMTAMNHGADVSDWKPH
jgi:hypothetical protein